jgi:hypothetical protein
MKKLDTVKVVGFNPKDFGCIYNPDNPINRDIAFDYYEHIAMKIQPTLEIE